MLKIVIIPLRAALDLHWACVTSDSNKHQNDINRESVILSAQNNAVSDRNNTKTTYIPY
jgi:hypothetical protein